MTKYRWYTVHVVRPFEVMLFAAGLAACGEPPEASPPECGAIGTPCGASCPADLECVGDVCVPVRGQCGGFAGAECQDATLTCTFPAGNSGGICMTNEAKACTCAVAPETLSDCDPARRRYGPTR